MGLAPRAGPPGGVGCGRRVGGRGARGAAGAALGPAAPRHPLPRGRGGHAGARLGWRALAGDAPAVRAAGLSVKAATALQPDALPPARAVQHAAFLAEAAPLPLVPPADVPGLLATLARLWAVRWENQHKDAFWRLTVDAIPLVGNSHVCRPAPRCRCGAAMAPSPRAHCFWDCPVAVAVRAELAREVGGPVTRADLWLARPPQGVAAPVWDVVCLAAVEAIERGRWSLAKGPAADDAVAAALPASGVHAAGVVAVASFWGALADFAALETAPRGWGGVAPDHPFLGRSVSNHLVLARPP